MAIYNPAGLYGGGAFNVDINPVLNVYLKRQAQEEAKQRELDKYFTGLTKNATSKGMATKDIPAFQQALNNYTNFYNSNKSKLISGSNAELQMKAEQLAKLPFEIANESIASSADLKQLNTVRTNPETSDLFDDETLGRNSVTNEPLIDEQTGAFKGIEGASQPIYIVDNTGQVVRNPKYTPFSINDLKFKPKPLSGKEMQDYIDNSFSGITPIEDATKATAVPYKNDPLKDVVSIPVGYDENQLKDMVNKMLTLYGDKRVKTTWEKNHPFEKDPTKMLPEAAGANEWFKSIYGRDVQNEAELFAAMNVYPKSKPTVKTDIVVNAVRSNEAALKKSKELARYENSLKGKDKTEYENTVIALDQFANGPIAGTTLRIEGGRVLNADGTPYNSAGNVADVVIKKSSGQVPIGVLDKIKESGIDPLIVPEVKLQVVNGQVKTILPKNAGAISRLDFIPKGKKVVTSSGSTGGADPLGLGL